MNANVDERVKRWLRLTTTTSRYQIDSINITESNVFAPQSIELGRAIAIVGLHGTGKSLLLRMIEAAFGYTASMYVPPFLSDKNEVKSRAPRLSGIVDVNLKTPKGMVSHTIDLDRPARERREIWSNDGVETFGTWYVDPTDAFGWLSFMYDNYDFTSTRRKRDIECDLKRADLNALRNILGRSYDRVTVRSALIDDGADDDLHLPFVTAELGSNVFDNTAMSQGELWVHYVNWFLTHQVNRGAAALLDEPETFIAARGHRPFIDHVCHQALRKELQLFIGTHSPDILSRFPLQNIRMCVPSQGGTRVVTPTSLFQIHEVIGIETPVRGIVLVEDQLANNLLGAAFAQYDTALTREVDIITANGASNVKNGLRLLRSANRLAFIGILDGDERCKSVDSTTDSRDSILFLPGKKSPEDELLSSALVQADHVAEAMNTRADNVVTAICSCQDLDHQYRIKAVARQLGQPEAALTSVLIRAWLRLPEIAQEAERLTSKIRSRLQAI